MLDKLAPGLILPTNPVDLTAQPLVDPDLYTRALPPLATDERYGSVVLGMILSSPTMAARKTEPVLKAIRSIAKRKPMVYAMLGDEAPVPENYVGQFRDLGIPFVRSPDRAMRALADRHASGRAAGEGGESEAAGDNRSGRNTARRRRDPGASRQGVAGGGRPAPCRKGKLARTLAEAEAAATSARVSRGAQGAGGGAVAQERCGRRDPGIGSIADTPWPMAGRGSRPTSPGPSRGSSSTAYWSSAWRRRAGSS